ncbi:MAG: M55 family metallopeptidase [Desulfurococcales archaeon]|nr:M55 family metallopeptidase [Desulfurococcales archaeon]
MGARAFVSIDAEGLPFIVGRYHLMPGDPLFQELREASTRLARLVASKLLESGYQEVVVADSHGAMVNVDPFKMPRGVRIVRGYPRPTSMIAGAQGSKAAFLLGYHSSPAQGGVLAHTYSGRIIQRINLPDARDVSEFLLNTYALGELGVPVALLAGDARLREEVARHAPWVVFVGLQEPVGSMGGLARSIEEVEEELGIAVDDAIARIESGEVRPLRPREPWIEVEFKRPWHADVAELFPCVERLDGLRVRLTCERYLDNFKMIEGLVMAAYATER